MRRTGLRIRIVTPSAPVAHHGNSATANRWAGMLRADGHHVEIRSGEACCDSDALPEVLIALHAAKSARAVLEFRAARPRAPVVLALTGTDLYPSLQAAGVGMRVLAAASRIVVLQHNGIGQVPERFRDRVSVIHQSAAVSRSAGGDQRPWRGPWQAVQIAQLAHLRAVKDPLLVAAAARLLPASSRIQVRHAGAVLDPELGRRARAEHESSARYRWLGELAPQPAAELLSDSDALVLTSRSEGGANVISEAIAARIPVIATMVPGTEGLLGRDYPGYVSVGAAGQLARMLQRFDTDARFRIELRDAITGLAGLADPEREREAWALLLNALLTERPETD